MPSGIIYNGTLPSGIAGSGELDGIRLENKF